LDWIQEIQAALEAGRPVLMQFAIAGASAVGGFTWFVNCWKSDKYQKQLLKRMFCDTFGGLTVGYFVSLPLVGSPDHYRASIAFILGLSWGVVAQYITERVTGVVLNTLEGAIRGAVAGLNQPAATATPPGTVMGPNQPAATATATQAVKIGDESPPETSGAKP
jgi:hypothetical protein